MRHKERGALTTDPRCHEDMYLTQKKMHRNKNIFEIYVLSGVQGGGFKTVFKHVLFLFLLGGTMIRVLSNFV